MERVKSPKRKKEEDVDLPDIAIDTKTKWHLEQPRGNRLMERPREEDQSNLLRVLEEDVGLEVEDLKSATVDQDIWRRIVEATTDQLQWPTRVNE